MIHSRIWCVLLVLSVPLLIIGTGCDERTTGSDTYFEGHIFYTITYTTTDPALDLVRLSELRGTRMVMSFKEGNFVQEYFNKQGRPVQKSIRNVAENRYYLTFPGLDTIYYTDTRNTGHVTQLNVIGQQVIAGYPCQEVLSVSMPTPDYPHFEPVRTRLFVTDSLRIDPAWYANYVDGAYDELARMIPGCTLRIVKENALYVMDIRATQVERGEVGMSAFAIDEGKVMLDALAR